MRTSPARDRRRSTSLCAPAGSRGGRRLRRRQQRCCCSTAPCRTTGVGHLLLLHKTSKSLRAELHWLSCTAYHHLAPKLSSLAWVASRLLPTHCLRCRDDHGRTPLHWAAFWGLEDCITGLVQAAERLRTEAAQAAAAAAAAATAAGAGAEGASGVRGGEEGLPPIWIMQVRGAEPWEG